MATKEFTDKQKEILARKLGYDGPMTEFEKFVKSDPALERKYSIVTNKLLMRKGGAVQKFQAGGAPAPIKPATPTVTAATIAAPTTTSGQLVTATGAPEKATAVTATTAPAATTITGEPKTAAATVTADLAQTDVEKALATLRAEQGQVSKDALVQAQTMEPTSTAISDLEAAQGVAREVEGAPVRKLEAGEVIEGPAVDRKAVEEALAKAEAAQGTVTEDMTVQGQLSRLVTDFEAGDPPAWAAASLRNVTATLAQRGLGASSLAGQALIQATLEAAIPIAAQDAQVYKDMGIQNLANKQQMAVLAAQQRAQFLGQEFDQAFQARVINASTISQIANVNFEAKQQIALENARLAQTMDLANLSNRQALVIAEAAQIATLETANLNNRQQAAVLNAQAFLAMDMANLDNRQQATMFKAQSVVNSILSDQAAENAARQFNAASKNQVDQFYASLSSQVKQFNATQTNAMAQFNTEQSNAIKQFNASVQNQRDQFNAENRRVIDQSNAEWRRNIATANTAAINRANEINATNALTLTTTEYNNLWQKYRDDIEYSWKTGENVLDRENELAKQVLSKQATIEAAEAQIEAAKYQALGQLATTLLDKAGTGQVIGDVLSSAAGFLWGSAASGASSLISGFKTVMDKLKAGTPIDKLPKFDKPVVGNVPVKIPGGRTEYFSDDYLNFISKTYNVTKGSDQANMLAEQDKWFYEK
jgi:hypothetical protein